MNSHERTATVKDCLDCKQTKPIDEFYVKRRLKSGASSYMSRCKTCYSRLSAGQYEKHKEARLARCREYRNENSERVAEYMRGYYQRNKDAIIQKCREYQSSAERKLADKIRQSRRYEELRDEIRRRQNAYNATPEGRARQMERYKRHYERNQEYYTAKRAKRRAAELRAMPGWVDPKELLVFFKMARELTRKTGVRHAVDHIVPLRGRNVCGLHVPGNLQVIPWHENAKKFNHFDG